MPMVSTSSVPVSTPVSSEGSAARCSPFCSTEIENRPKKRAPDGAAPAEHGGAAQHDGGDRRQFVAGAGVGLRLSEVRHIDDGREARDQAREKVHQRRRAAPPECRRSARRRR